MKYDQLEDLRIYRAAERVADLIWQQVEEWHYYDKDTVGKQLIRAADSIGANIAEGYGRHHKNDNLRFLFIARGSLQETIYWLKRAIQRKRLPETKGEELIRRLENLAPQLNSFIAARRGRE
jgi:four helix bundle protein